MIKTLVILGTRPDAIKLAPVIRELRRRRGFRVRICATDQHRQLLDPILDLFAIRPDHRLDIMRRNQRLERLTARLIERIARVLASEKPDLVVLQGDTTTALAAALSAYYARLPIAHVEAGLRTATKFAPFPEEMNRRLVTRLADFHFAPTKRARENLLREGVPLRDIAVTGNTAIDALLHVARRIGRTTRPPAPLARVRWGKSRVIIATCHRRESFGEPLERVCRALLEIASRNPDTDIVFPVHANPNVRRPARQILRGRANIHLVEPLDYRSFVWAMMRAYLIITDSGGIQEEAPSLGVPVLVVRDSTERLEAIEAGSAHLVGTDTRHIVAQTQLLLDDPSRRDAMIARKNPFGDGRAAKRIVSFLARRLAGKSPTRAG